MSLSDVYLLNGTMLTPFGEGTVINSRNIQDNLVAYSSHKNFMDKPEVYGLIDKSYKDVIYPILEFEHTLTPEGAIAYYLAKKCYDNMFDNPEELVVGCIIGNTTNFNDIDNCRTASDYYKLFNNTIALNVANKLHLNGPSFGLSSACSTSLHALMVASQMIHMGIADVMLIGGVDLYNSHMQKLFKRLGILAKHNCKPLADDRNGTLISEGCGICILGNKYALEHYKESPIATIMDANCNTSESLTLTTSNSIVRLYKSMNLRRYSQLSPLNINLHATGTIAGDNEELSAIKIYFPDWENTTKLTYYKGNLGHTMAASGVIELLIALHNLKSGEILVKNNFGLGGSNCVAVIQKW